MATPATRPISTSFLAESLAPSTSSDLFATHIATAPFLFPAPPPSAPPGPAFYHSEQAGHAPNNRSIVAVLSHRIRDLESALQQEREAHEAALEANAAFADDAAATHAETVQLRRELFAALARGGGPSPSASAESSGELAEENAALAAECERLRRFVGIMLAAGETEPKPVVQAAYERVLEGEQPEAALVAAIKQAVAQPGNVWRELLEPVTGVRTQDEYLAQVRCTLSARAQTQDWRKRARFWKSAAREEGRHAETVTPSVSAMSAVADVLPEERRERAEELLGRVQAGEACLRVARTAVPQENGEPEVLQDCGPTEPEPTSVPESVSATSSASSSADRSGVQAIVDANTSMEESPFESAPADIGLPASSSSMVLPTALSTSTARLAYGHSNLPPLASETFRASHSIKTLSSRGSRRSALGVHMVTSPTGDSVAKLARAGARDSGNSLSLSLSISASASASTQNSTKSRRRRAKVVAVPVAPACTPAASRDTLAASVKKRVSMWSFFGSSRAASPAASVVAQEVETGSAQADTPGNNEELSPSRSDSSHGTPSLEHSVDTMTEDPAPKTPHRLSPPSLPKELLDFSSSPDDDLVLVLHSDFSGSSYRAPASPTRIAGAGPGSAHTTPEKRSRLPVRMRGLKAIKRFSASINISRPVLVDTTNAASFGFSAAPAPRRAGVQKGHGASVVGVGAAPAAGVAGRARAPSAAGRAGAGSPPSKIPMGRRLPKFGLGGQQV